MVKFELENENEIGDNELPGDKKNATFEKRRQGVKRETLRRLSCYNAFVVL